MSTGFCWANLRERDPWGEPDVDGRIILKWKVGRDVHRVLVRKPEGKRPLGRTSRRWEDNIKVDVGQRIAQGFGGGKPEGR
jgi:hypothetical protein